MVSDTVLWSIADALDMPLSRQKENRVSGKISRDVMLGWLRVQVPLRIISSAQVRDGYVVLARSMGDLGVFVARPNPPTERVEVGIINLALVDKPTKLFENGKPADLAEAYALVAEAEVRWFRKSGKAPWRELAAG